MYERLCTRARADTGARTHARTRTHARAHTGAADGMAADGGHGGLREARGAAAGQHGLSTLKLNVWKLTTVYV
jgi:hypothetical protein